MSTMTTEDRQAELNIENECVELPMVIGSENETAVNIETLRAKTGCVTLDEGYRNTASVRSAITYINGEQGILRYRGIPIEELAGKKGPRLLKPPVPLENPAWPQMPSRPLGTLNVPRMLRPSDDQLSLPVSTHWPPGQRYSVKVTVSHQSMYIS